MVTTGVLQCFTRARHIHEFELLINEKLVEPKEDGLEVARHSLAGRVEQKRRKKVPSTTKDM